MPTRYQQVCEKLRSAPETWLVTGVAGFIGSHLLSELLNLGQRVIGFDNFSTGKKANLTLVKREVGKDAWSRFSFVKGDITKIDSLRKNCSGATRVLHQAALGSVPRSLAEPLKTHAANIDGMLNVLEFCREFKVARLVYASSSSVYGDHEALPKREEAFGRPLSPYALSKRVNEEYADLFTRCYGMQTIGLRYFNVFGARQDPLGSYAAVVPRWLQALCQGEQCVIFGDGKTSRDFCYVKNVVQANILAAMVDYPGVEKSVFNVACAEQLSLTELYIALQQGLKACGKISDKCEGPPQYTEFRQGDIRHSLADISRSRELLGYEPMVTVREGIVELTQHFLSVHTA